MFLGREIVNGAAMLDHKLRPAFHRFAICEKGDRIIALDSDTCLVEIDQCFRLGRAAKPKAQYENHQRYKSLHNALSRARIRSLTVWSILRGAVRAGVSAKHGEIAKCSARR